MTTNFPGNLDSFTRPTSLDTLATTPHSTHHDNAFDAIEAVERKLLGEYVSVVDKGADPTGVADSRAAIQAAIDALGARGGTVYFPPGTYVINSKLTMAADNIQLLGAGRGGGAVTANPIDGSVIKAADSWTGTDPMLDAVTTKTFGTTIEGLQFHANERAETCVHIASKTGGGETSYSLITRCLFKRYTTTGVKAGTGTSGEFSVFITFCFFDGRIDPAPPSLSSVTTQRGIWLLQPDNYIAFNRINTHREAGIYVERGGQQIIGNHIFASGNTTTTPNYPTCIKYVRGGTQTCTANYFDNARQNAQIVIRPQDASSGIEDIVFSANTFVEANIMRDATDTANANYPVFDVDASQATVRNLAIIANTGRANSTTQFSFILNVTSGTNLTNVAVVNNIFQTILTAPVSDMAAVTQFSGNMQATNKGSGRVESIHTMIDGAFVTPVPANGVIQSVDLGGSRTISAPATTRVRAGSLLILRLKNNTAGAITTTWNAAYKLSGAWVDPAAGKVRCIGFFATANNVFVEAFRTDADITE